MINKIKSFFDKKQQKEYDNFKKEWEAKKIKEIEFFNLKFKNAKEKEFTLWVARKKKYGCTAKFTFRIMSNTDIYESDIEYIHEVCHFKAKINNEI